MYRNINKAFNKLIFRNRLLNQTKILKDRVSAPYI